MEMEECTLKYVDETSNALVNNAIGLNAAEGMDLSHNEGRGDPTSTMMWSPRSM
jgi:hypothetical protein